MYINAEACFFKSNNDSWIWYVQFTVQGSVTECVVNSCSREYLQPELDLTCRLIWWGHDLTRLHVILFYNRTLSFIPRKLKKFIRCWSGSRLFNTLIYIFSRYSLETMASRAFLSAGRSCGRYVRIIKANSVEQSISKQHVRTISSCKYELLLTFMELNYCTK